MRAVALVGRSPRRALSCGRSWEVRRCIASAPSSSCSSPLRVAAPIRRWSNECLAIVERGLRDQGKLQEACGSVVSMEHVKTASDGEDRVLVTARARLERCSAEVRVKVSRGSRELEDLQVRPPQGKPSGPRTTDPGPGIDPTLASVEAYVAHPACCKPPFDCGGRAPEHWERIARTRPREGINGPFGPGSEAIDALECIGKPAVPALARLLSMSFDDPRYASYTAVLKSEAAAALQHLGPDAAEAVPVLVQRLQEDEDELARISIIFALANIGPPARPALPALLEIATGATTHAKAARMAVARIDPDAARAAGFPVEEESKPIEKAPATGELLASLTRVAGTVTHGGQSMEVKGGIGSLDLHTRGFTLLLLPVETPAGLLEASGLSERMRLLIRLPSPDPARWSHVPRAEIVFGVDAGKRSPKHVGIRVNGISPSKNLSTGLEPPDHFALTGEPGPGQKMDVAVRGSRFGVSCDVDVSFEFTTTGRSAPAR